MPARKSTSYHGKHNWYGKTWKVTKPTRSPAATYYPCNSPRYKSVRDECQWRMGSYRNVYSQFTGAGTKTPFSPTTASKWIKYVNSGALVYKFSNKDFCQYFGHRWATASPRAAYQYLRNHFGPTIKDVARGKGNCWLVATTRNATGRPFSNYNWW